MNGLTEGVKYTVREIVVDCHPRFPGVGLHLEEIHRHVWRGVSTPYASARFRALVKTDISIFTAMLNFQPQKENV